MSAMVTSSKPWSAKRSPATKSTRCRWSTGSAVIGPESKRRWTRVQEESSRQSGHVAPGPEREGVLLGAARDDARKTEMRAVLGQQQRTVARLGERDPVPRLVGACVLMPEIPSAGEHFRMRHR